MLTMLRLAVVLISPGVGSTAVSRSEILAALELATRDTAVKLIEMSPDVVDRCEGHPGCISRERPAEVSHVLVVTHASEEAMQDRLTIQILGKTHSSDIEYWIDDPDQLVPFWKTLIAEELDREGSDSSEVTALVLHGDPIKRYQRAKEAVAWSSAIVATGGFAMLVYAIFGPQQDDRICFGPDSGFCSHDEDRSRRVVGLAQSIAYGMIAGGITTSIAAFVSSDDAAPWWQPLVGAVVMGATLGLTLLFDHDDPRASVFSGALGSR